ncbi:MAG: glycosyltransferase family A protein [Phenylobacterium sp.]|uniref:glycosyltransferase family 2 protein n=1 Tax=Phenylobacterium sp. TaxID=1871053 RepID=UPI00273665AB|nr:glycosyltransferase family A protein [Phenylobacterium sp.]MDP3174775.1 glycosyltransferase family A protein [Phenylobacterium sp.]
MSWTEPPAVQTLDVCVCTFRRASVEATLHSIAAQVLPEGFSLRVVVADNDDAPSARARVQAAADALELMVDYVHAPARNISTARNACLDAVTADWFAFIDDDETAAPDWIAKLWAAREGVDIVFGVAQALYAIDAPGWMVRGDYHTNTLARERTVISGYTSNVLVRTAIVGSLRFDPALGLVGGEDTLFFHALMRGGATFAFAPDALVFEPVSPARASLGWILKRKYRAGQTHAHLIRTSQPGQIGKVAVLAAAKSGYSLLGAVACAPMPTRAIQNLTRAVFHAGVVAYSLGGRFYAEYAKPAASG